MSGTPGWITKASKTTIPINTAKIFFWSITNPPKCKISKVIITDAVMFRYHIMSNQNNKKASETDAFLLSIYKRNRH
ncbi:MULTISPECIES: hypothetical protein [Bacillus]|uniref:hypothetical protein n=1 Tax=Bacillus TaxID=1386 RepID=UPI0015928F5A|nr:hypothetical protein [Bacillus cereus]